MNNEQEIRNALIAKASERCRVQGPVTGKSSRGSGGWGGHHDSVNHQPHPCMKNRRHSLHLVVPSAGKLSKPRDASHRRGLGLDGNCRNRPGPWALRRCPGYSPGSRTPLF